MAYRFVNLRKARLQWFFTSKPRYGIIDNCSITLFCNGSGTTARSYELCTHKFGWISTPIGIDPISRLECTVDGFCDETSLGKVNTISRFFPKTEDEKSMRPEFHEVA